MHPQIDLIKKESQLLRDQILQHPVYSAIQDLDDLKIFMQYHIFAVWDFMSILKSLQNNLTCTSIPWVPKGNAETRYLINEIVLGEESDVDQNGIRKSHFELYLDAMKDANADTLQISTFIKYLLENKDFDMAYQKAHVPTNAQEFVNFTFEIINTNKPHLQAAIFTFGREDLIPGMFMAMVEDLYKNFPENISTFKYYLERHIEVDGDHHSHLALQMSEHLCGNDKLLWEEARMAVLASLEKRIKLWDGAYEEITSLKFA